VMCAPHSHPVIEDMPSLIISRYFFSQNDTKKTSLCVCYDRQI
jgi:hypothetical protein